MGRVILYSCELVMWVVVFGYCAVHIFTSDSGGEWWWRMIVSSVCARYSIDEWESAMIRFVRKEAR